MRKRFVMALCAIAALTAACGPKQIAEQDQRVNIFLTGPSGLTQCSDLRNNDPDEDNLIDAADPDCHWDGNAGNPASYDPSDNSERRGGGPPNVVSNRPGDFNLFGTCVGTRARLSWTHSDRADGAFIERRLWSSGPWVRLSKFYSVSERTNVEVDADISSANYWRVVAVNAAGETFSRSPEERDDKTATFACGPPAPPPPPPPTGGGPSPGPGPSGPGPGGPTGPPTGGQCAGSSISFPDLTARGQTKGFAVSVPAGCQWGLASNNHHVVSITPASGTGPAQGSVHSLPGASGAAFVLSFSVGGSVISSRSYNIP